jgi:hypothetical protein
MKSWVLAIGLVSGMVAFLPALAVAGERDKAAAPAGKVGKKHFLEVGKAYQFVFRKEYSGPPPVYEVLEEPRGHWVRVKSLKEGIEAQSFWVNLNAIEIIHPQAKSK